MIIYGVNPVLDCINLYSEKIVKLYVSKRSINKFSKKQLGMIKDISIEYLSDREFENLSKTNNHQSVAAEIKVNPIMGLSELKQNINDLGKVVILDHIQDPQNIGAIARTAVFFGVSTIILPSNRTASVSPGSVKSSSGSIFSVNFYQVSNLGNAIDELKGKDYWILGAHLDGDDYKDAKYDKFIDEKIAIVMGSEEKGLSPLISKNCDILVRIKRKGLTNSLNVNVATAILLSRFLS
ncbi:23S rRNA (guanosine(2251)-2'-O)-methyltransferase RlmB [bacterium]|nr:23S rRNA (guanosine(2251)-2'-O)-methyltransferase RlmB [bacterium]